MKIWKKLLLFIFLLTLIQSIAFTQEKDVEGSKDHPLLSRMQNFYISDYKMYDYESHEFYDAQDNEYVIEGKKWIIDYTLKEGIGFPGQFKVRKNYINAIKKMGGSILFEHGLYMKVTNGNKEIWIDIWVNSDGSDYRLTIVEKAVMAQEVVTDPEATAREFKKTEKPGLTGRPMQEKEGMKDPEIQRVKLALAKIKRNRAAVLSTFKRIEQNVNKSLALTCPGGVPPAGAIPIPYPNIASASDTAKHTKSVIADKAEMIAVKSEFTKSEGDEIGVTIKRLSDLIQSRYEKGDLNDKDKTSYTKKLTSYLEQAKLLADAFEKYVEDVEKLLDLLERFRSRLP